MKNLLILCLLFLLASCADTSQSNVTVCNCQQKEKVANLIHSSIKNANNYSDEEMEDVISQLEQTYRRTICSETLGTYKNDGGWSSHWYFDYTSVKQDSCLTYYP